MISILRRIKKRIKSLFVKPVIKTKKRTILVYSDMGYWEKFNPYKVEVKDYDR